MTDRVPRQPIADGRARPAWLAPTALVLVAANLVPLYGVLALGWTVLSVVVLFWLENIVIGVLNALRMAVADPGNRVAGAQKLFLVPFFCVHYGLFTAIHGLFVFSLFGGESYLARVDGLWTAEAARRVIEESALWPALAALALSHLFSFVLNYLGRGEYRHARPAVLMRAPYGRVVVLHVAIIGGAFLVMEFDSPLWALVLLIALKIGLDLRAHLREHRAGPATAAGPV